MTYYNICKSKSSYIVFYKELNFIKYGMLYIFPIFAMHFHYSAYLITYKKIVYECNDY